MRKLIFTVLLSAFAFQAGAQSVALRWILGETNRIYNNPKFDNYCMGLGVDRTFNEKLTAGFDISYDIGNAASGSPAYLYLVGGDYTIKPGLLTMNYHTEFAIGDDGGTHAYIGTFVGLRKIWQNWTRVDYTNGSLPPTRKFSELLVPVGLRLGLRGATDGGFMDLYVALGYQIGGGEKIADVKLAHTDQGFIETTSLALSIGLAYGIGW
ncbi:MAG: hypothetical protein ABIY71_00695 [Flavobacteriales bacterium]